MAAAPFHLVMGHRQPTRQKAFEIWPFESTSRLPLRAILASIQPLLEAPNCQSYQPGMKLSCRHCHRDVGHPKSNATGD
jgi:hypothetical protein